MRHDVEIKERKILVNGCMATSRMDKIPCLKKEEEEWRREEQQQKKVKKKMHVLCWTRIGPRGDGVVSPSVY